MAAPGPESPSTPPATPPPAAPPSGTPPPRGVRFATEPSRPAKGRGCLIAAVVFLGLLSIVLLLALVGYAEGGLSTGLVPLEEQTLEEGTSPKKVAVIEVRGIIASEGLGPFVSAASAELIQQQLRQAAKDDDVVAVVLELDTPGGELVATDQAYHELQRLRFPHGEGQPGGKPVVACMKGMAASGGYYLAAGCDYIIANRLSWTGSIGVIVPGFNYQDLMEKKLGIRDTSVMSGELKDMFSGARPRDPREDVLIRALVDQSFEEFARIVAKGRKLDLATVKGEGIGDARVLSGQQALALKLVDELGFPEDAYAKARELGGEPDARVICYQPRPSLLQSLLSASARERPSELTQVLSLGRPALRRGCPYLLCPLAL